MKIKYISFFILAAGLYSCKKFVEVGSPKSLITASAVYSNDATATSVIRGIYSQMINNSSGFASGGSSSVSFKCGLSADELKNFANDVTYIAFYTNALSVTNFDPALWSEPYTYINNANAVIEGLTNSSGVSQMTKKELSGEAKFIRAFCHFYLVNLFGDVPLITTTDFRVNADAPRTASADVYQQIISDLKDAQGLLAGDFSFSKGERDQPNKWAATALLARVYLYLGDWADAEAQATAIINNTGVYSLAADLNTVFLANNSEAIWQLKPAALPFTNEGSLFILSSTPGFAALSQQLLDSFESGDNRKINWIDSVTDGGQTYYYPYKYKVNSGTSLTEYSMVLRLAEQYLIRGEARANQNNIAGAQADLNVIRSRAGLPNTTAGDIPSLISAILHERQLELFTEWGHRWLDLKRTKTVNSAMNIITPQKGGNWNSNQQLYPIPLSDIINDVNLRQNAGY